MELVPAKVVGKKSPTDRSSTFRYPKSVRILVPRRKQQCLLCSALYGLSQSSSANADVRPPEKAKKAPNARPAALVKLRRVRSTPLTVIGKTKVPQFLQFAFLVRPLPHPPSITRPKAPISGGAAAIKQKSSLAVRN